MEQKRGYEENLKNTGAQEVPARKKGSGVQKGKAVRGKDLRGGK